MVYFQDFVTDDSFASFNFLCEHHNLPKSYFYSLTFTGYSYPPSKDLLPSFLDVNSLHKGAISKTYALIRNSCPDTWDKARTKLEGQVGEVISKDTWKNTTQCTHASALCVRHGLIQFKAVHRLHYSSDKLSKLHSCCGRQRVCTQQPTPESGRLTRTQWEANAWFAFFTYCFVGMEPSLSLLPGSSSLTRPICRRGLAVSACVPSQNSYCPVWQSYNLPSKLVSAAQFVSGSPPCLPSLDPAHLSVINKIMHQLCSGLCHTISLQWFLISSF